jgi:predicted acetyltransferase
MIRLVPITLDREAEFIEMRDEWLANRQDPYDWLYSVAWTDFANYVKLCDDLREGKGPLADLVPADTLWIEEDGRVVGTVSARYGLTDALRRRGGHIGYSVRPSARNRGIATQATRLALELLRRHGITEALITCDETNAASARVIEKCGGRRIEDSVVEGEVIRRYLVFTGRSDD